MQCNAAGVCVDLDMCLCVYSLVANTKCAVSCMFEHSFDASTTIALALVFSLPHCTQYYIANAPIRHIFEYILPIIAGFHIHECFPHVSYVLLSMQRTLFHAFGAEMKKQCIQHMKELYEVRVIFPFAETFKIVYLRMFESSSFFHFHCAKTNSMQCFIIAELNGYFSPSNIVQMPMKIKKKNIC